MTLSELEDAWGFPGEVVDCEYVRYTDDGSGDYDGDEGDDGDSSDGSQNNR
jgi:hypothetical protein